MLAKSIFEAIPGTCKDIALLDGQTDYDMADLYFIGFWTDRGTASVDVLDYLGSLGRKKDCPVRHLWYGKQSGIL